MFAPTDKAFQHLGSFPQRLNLGLVHLHPSRRAVPACEVKGLPDGLGRDQPLIEPVNGLEGFGHAVPLDALASLAAPAAAGLALMLLAEQALTLGFIAFVGGLLLGSGEFGRLGFGLESCFRWGIDPARCGPGLGRWRVSRTPQIGIQGDTKEGVKGDAEVFGFGACSGVKGVWES